MTLVFTIVGERSGAKNYRPVSLLSVVSQVFEKLVNNEIVNHLGKCGLSPDFQYDFRSSQSSADLLTVVSDRIARAFNRSGATRAVALDISKAFDRVCHAGLLHKLRSWGIFYQIFGLNSSFLSSAWLRVVESIHRSFLLMLDFLKSPFFALHFSGCIFMAFLMVLSLVLVSMLMILLSILGVIRHLIYGGSLSWLLNLNLICRALWTGLGSD